MNRQMATLQTLHPLVNKHDQDIKTLVAENQSMKVMIKNLSSKIDNFEQKCNNNKLQINQVTCTLGENLHRIVLDVAQKLEVAIDKSDIIDVYRTKSNQAAKPNTAQKNANVAISNEFDPNGGELGVESSVNGANIAVTDNPIIVNLKSRATSMEILSAYRNIPDHKLFLDNHKKRRIFINEFLIPNRRRLFYKTKLFCKVNNYKYIWTRNGNIFIRKEDGSKKIHINCNVDFASIENCTDGEAAAM